MSRLVSIRPWFRQAQPKSGLPFDGLRASLDRRQPLAGTELSLDWRAQTKRRYWPMVPLLGLILQVEPCLGILRGFLGRMAQYGKRPLTQPEKGTLLCILRERGAAEWAEYQGMWDRELAAHRRVIQRRRDLAFRLGRLAALDLEAVDHAKVGSLQAANIRWRDGRMVSLTAKQVRLVEALEAQYLEQRAEASLALAETLANEFGLPPPQ